MRLRLLRFQLGLMLVWLAQAVLPREFIAFVEHESSSRFTTTEGMTDADIAQMIRQFRADFDGVDPGSTG